MTIGPAQRSSLDASAPRPDTPPLATPIAGVLQSRPVSRSTRAALVALLFSTALFVAGNAPAMAQVVPVGQPLPFATPAEATPVAEATPPGAPGGDQVAVDTATSPDPAATTAAAEAPASAPDAAVGSEAAVAAPTTYVVQAKDTAYSIARRHGVSVDALLWANDLADANVLKEGQKLTIPPSSGALYPVKDGDTLDSVAKAHGVSLTGIAAVNGLAEDGSLTVGQRLLIPAPRQVGSPDPAFSPVAVTAAQVSEPVPVPSVAATATPTTTPAPTSTPAPSAASRSLVAAAAPVVKPTDRPSAAPSGTPSVTVTTRKLPKLQWPVPITPPKIGITQRFQPGHTGIDIGAPEGTPIKAMADGVVKRAEKGDNGGYGWLVVLDHGEGVTTWYAHQSEISVAVGDKVQAGQKVGAAGATGRSTGPHLHFEVRVGNTPIDPLIALPK